MAADADISEKEIRDFGTYLEKRYGKVKLISVEGNARALIVKTTNEVAPLLRSPERPLRAGGKALVAVLTSGGVGKLKRTASTANAHGEVP